MRNQKSNEKCNVLFILPSLNRAGAEMQVVDLLIGFERRQFEVFLFTFDENLSLLEKLRDCPLHHVNHVRKHKYDFSMIPVISRMIDENEIDVVHTTLQIALLLGWLGCKFSKRRPPIIHSLHKMVGKNRKERFLDKYIFGVPMRSASRIIFVCEKQKECWCEEFEYLRNKGVVIYNGIDIFRFNENAIKFNKEESRKKYGIPRTSSVISSIAGFRLVKKHSDLVSAFAMVLKESFDAYLLLVGDGPERANIEKMVSDLNLEGKIYFCGNIDDVREILLLSDFTVISSASEALSLAMIESMAMSRPVISTDVGGHKEVITDGVTGAIVPQGDIKMLARSMQNFLKDKTLLGEMGEKACMSIQKKYTMEIMIKNTEKLVREVSAGL